MSCKCAGKCKVCKCRLPEMVEEHERLVSRLKSGKDLDDELSIQEKELKQLKRFLKKEG